MKLEWDLGFYYLLKKFRQTNSFTKELLYSVDEKKCVAVNLLFFQTVMEVCTMLKDEKFAFTHTFSSNQLFSNFI